MHLISALEFRQWIGGEKKINEYCHNLAVSGGKRLAEMFGTQVMDEDGTFTANMVRNHHAISKGRRFTCKASR